jgi:hypothetical protein
MILPSPLAGEGLGVRGLLVPREAKLSPGEMDPLRLESIEVAATGADGKSAPCRSSRQGFFI